MCVGSGTNTCEQLEVDAVDAALEITCNSTAAVTNHCSDLRVDAENAQSLTVLISGDGTNKGERMSLTVPSHNPWPVVILQRTFLD